MNNLQIFKEQQLISLQENKNGEVIISGRELHEFLEVKTRYNDWFERMISYGFVENTDFIAITQKRVTAQGNETTYTDHAIKLDMAKELAMIQRNEKGRQARKYFIAVEKAWNSPEMIMKRALEIANRNVENLKLENEEQKKQLQEQKPKVLFAEAVENSEDIILVKEMATILTQHGFEVGQNQLFTYLRKYGYLCSKKGGMYNLPTKRYEHLFKVIKRNIQHTEGTEVKNTPKITGKGQIYFIKKFAEYKLQGLTINDLLKKYEGCSNE
ncbi:antA/AntB antirepressor family protein [Clostridium botulinum]|uniref:antA/AntB antirepressor family protein n=1 Tax=Clostridium botulinum TaxID=1491 RepID=UPI00059BBA17|nr:antA/AntB antirepressor family protein [Clostridium botulinum]KIN82152.1 oxidoreductase [Clostridium botulinum]MCC5428303.1 antA/AntB antirepressor family protein [Clostridium botulinum]MCC5437681.1 antA/AntB antirepressor family protein [Clostridium botulinum]